MTRPTLKTVSVSIDNLLLDPNNPRFVQGLKHTHRVPDSEVVSLQDKVQSRFRCEPRRNRANRNANRRAPGEEFYDVLDLVESMKAIGVVLVDQIVVRPLARDSERYVVIEGNRRVAAAKLLIEQQKMLPEARRLDVVAPVRWSTLQRIQVLVLNWDALDEDARQEFVSVVLGLRHFGGVKEWEKHPKAHNIYSEYMNCDPPLAAFEFSTARARQVAARLSIRPAAVRKALRAIIAYRQLEEMGEALRSHHFHLIETLVTRRSLETCGYLTIDAGTFAATEQSLEKLALVCQFDIRDGLTGADREEQIILQDEKKVAHLAKLVTAAFGDPDIGVKNLACLLLDDVEEGKRTLASAKDELVGFQRRKKWITELTEMLDKRESELDMESFKTFGNDRAALDAATGAFRNMRTILISR